MQTFAVQQLMSARRRDGRAEFTANRGREGNGGIGIAAQHVKQITSTQADRNYTLVTACADRRRASAAVHDRELADDIPAHPDGEQRLAPASSRAVTLTDLGAEQQEHIDGRIAFTDEIAAVAEGYDLSDGGNISQYRYFQPGRKARVRPLTPALLRNSPCENVLPPPMTLASCWTLHPLIIIIRGPREGSALHHIENSCSPVHGVTWVTRVSLVTELEQQARGQGMVMRSDPLTIPESALADMPWYRPGRSLRVRAGSRTSGFRRSQRKGMPK